MAETWGVELSEIPLKRGSRTVDTSFVDAEGNTKPDLIPTARSRDWLEGSSQFKFSTVSPVDADGNQITAAWVPTVPDHWESDISVDILGLDGELMSAVPVLSRDTVHRLSHRVSATLNVPLLELQMIWQGKLLSNTRCTLDALGIRNAAQLRLVLRPPTPSSGLIPIAPEDLVVLNTALDRVRQVALNIRSNQAEWVRLYKARVAIAKLSLKSALTAMRADIGALGRSYAAVWGREIAAAGGQQLSELIFPEVLRQPGKLVRYS